VVTHLFEQGQQLSLIVLALGVRGVPQVVELEDKPSELLKFADHQP
jgi:hypothetical protein